jgi:hypothetical protein
MTGSSEEIMRRSILACTLAGILGVPAVGQGLGIICVAAALFISNQAVAQTTNQIATPGVTAQDKQQLRYSIRFADQHSITHFRDENLLWQTENVGTLLLRTTPYLNAEKSGFRRLPQGFSADWHPAPGKRFVMVLTGIAQVEAGLRLKVATHCLVAERQFLNLEDCR